MAVTKAKPTIPVAAYGLLKFTYGCEVVLPLEEATAIMSLFSQAERYESDYKQGKTHYYIGGPLPEISLSLLSSEEYFNTKLNGEKPRGD